MKVALYLGSFNPFHNGHLKAVLTALNDFKMDKVIIVPKNDSLLLDINKRYEIIINTILFRRFDDQVKVSLIEKELIPPFYNYATLHALKNKYCNDEVFVLVSEDTIKKIPNWMHGGKVIEDYNFLIVDKTKASISSSYIRELLKDKYKNISNKKLSKYVSPNIIGLLRKYY